MANNSRRAASSSRPTGTSRGGAQGAQTEQSALTAALAKVAQLEQALESSRVIGAAVGVIMTLEKLPYDRAFEVLSQSSQRQSRKLRDLAEEIVSFGTVLGRTG